MSKNKTKFIFWGTPDVAAETLEILREQGYVPSMIVTAPDRPKGRKMLITPPPAKVWAEKNRIPYIQPSKLDREFIKKLGPSCLEPNCLFVVVAYGKMMPERILNMPKLGSINIHYSLLPKYRGASPVESAILSGDTETGVTIQKMQLEMDSGPIIAQEKVQIGRNDKSEELRKRLIKIGAELLIETLPEFIAGKIEPVPQDEAAATYCGKIKKEDGLINLSGDGTKNYNKFRAYASWPRTFFFQNGKRIIITDAELADGKFIIKKVLPEGKKEISYEEFLRLR